ncbi:MAG: TolC family protein [Gemmatimonadota bacterium]
MRTYMKIPVVVAGIALILLAWARPGAAQESEPADLAALLDIARAENPEIRAAAEAVGAARARVRAAGLLPDPMLGVGLLNALVSEPLSSDDFMTMRMVQVGQRLPYPGKLGLEREIAAWELAAAEAERERAELEVVASVKRAYYEIFFLDRALEVVRDNRDLLTDFVSVTEARYGVGTGGQQDVLKAQVEESRLGDELVALAGRRAAAVAELNALLDRPSPTPVGEPAIPRRIERAAVPEPGTEVRFTAAALGTVETGGPIPDLATLQKRAEAGNPMLRAHVARIGAQKAALRLAEKAALPDFDVSLGYGQRGGREDMLTAMVSIPIPLRKGRKQDALAAAERSELANLEAMHDAMVNDVHAEVADLHASLLKARDQLALLREGILPQARASLESAVAGYPVASVDFLTLIDNQATLFRHELDHHRLLAEFAQDLAELERVVRGEVLR